jgi:hypothetical protein
MNSTIQKSFTVNDAKGNLLPGIKNAFLAHSVVDMTNPPPNFRAANNVVYQAVYDNFYVADSEKTQFVKVIISFQQHDDGNFAIIRTLNPSNSKA